MSLSATLRGLFILVCMLLADTANAEPVMTGHTQRPLRYRPDGTDFVIENGAETFNRPLYGSNSAFRVDGGDKPEFVFYLPGRGGNLRLGIRSGGQSKWLHEAEHIITRYRPGSMVYEIRDPLIGAGTLRLTALASATGEGMIVKAELEGTITLISAFGGVNGAKGRRDGDIGTEGIPVSEFFQFKPEYCRDNDISVSGGSFLLKAKPATLTGVFPEGSKLALADANQWRDLDALLATRGQPGELPIVVAETILASKQPAYLALQRMKEAAPPTADELPAVFDAAEKRREEIAGKITVETPDPFINAAASALCVAADGVWGEPDGAFMHGAVAWRRKLLGWRGPYSGDALGWHDRLRRHLTYWAGRQNTGAIPETMPAPEPEANLARNETALHSNGDMSGAHYDMNLVYIDALFRHLLWTGDLEFARSVWPVIERHLAWERRLFRRPFGPDGLPLYEAYACIWASDDLWYNGGGATHATAYNYWHHQMAAKLAKALGVNPSPYEQEAALISKAIRRELWLPKQGWFAEGKDLLGEKLVRPSPALWTFYHTLDSEVPDAMEAWQMSRFVDTRISHIPIHGAGVPGGGYFTLPTSNWMPYAWSTNNVVMAEAAHASLAFWQAGRANEAFRLFKGCLLDSMFMGLCPGNAGMATTFDMARGESQRDFADAVGTSSRALVEGLFGIRPDALAGELTVRPGFPQEWDRANLHHPSLKYSFQRNRLQESWTMEPNFRIPMKLRLQIPARHDRVASVTNNGRPAKWKVLSDSVGFPRIEIECAAAPRQEVTIIWQGEKLISSEGLEMVASGEEVHADFAPARLKEIADPQQALGTISTDAHSFRATANGEPGHRTVFTRVEQGDLTWWHPLTFEIRPELEMIEIEPQTADSLRFRVRNNSARTLQASVSGRSFVIPTMAESEEIVLTGGKLLPGSNRVVIGLEGRTFEGIATNWKLNAPDKTVHWEPVDLSSVLNDSVTRIFRNDYLAPRSPFCSLATPRQGYGSWCHPAYTFEVDDTGLRAVADRNQARLILPQGIPFVTPGAGGAGNIGFTSQWTNYPKEITAPLHGHARHIYLLMAGSTTSMQSRIDNGEVTVTYTDGSEDRLALHNPTTWWPIDQDYVIDDHAFRRPEPIPPRVHLKTGEVRVSTFQDLAGKSSNLMIPGGAATVLDLPLRPEKELKSLTVRTIANEVVIGLMSATLVRPD